MNATGQVDPEHGDHDERERGAALLSPTARSRSWLWPAVAVVVVLVLAIGAGRLGEAPAPPEASHRAAVATLLAPTRRPAGPPASLTVHQRPIYAPGASLIGPPIGIRTDTDRFDDGILAVLDGEPVLRVRDAATLPVGSVALVGGWQTGVRCPSEDGARQCLALSDLPFRSARAAALVLGGQASFDNSEGPRVFSATVQADPSCTISAFDGCLDSLIVGAPLWQGDEETMTEPIDGAKLLGGITTRFPTLDMHSFAEASSCPVRWPTQSYLFSDPNAPLTQFVGDVRMVVLFPTTDDRVAFEPDLSRASATLTRFDAYNRCVAIPFGVDDTAWVVRDNAMILLGSDDPGVRATINVELSDAAVVG